MLFRFVISQRDILPSGQYLLAFYFAEISVRSLRMNTRRHSLFLCLKARKEDCRTFPERHATRKEKKMDFRIVLFENEGYATARGDKGVQDILAAKTGAGYIKEGTFPIIITLYQSCWEWWISPKHQKIDFSTSSADSWLDRPLWKNKPIQQRIIAALEDWQKKYLRANETIKMISSGKHILYHCNVTNVCGDAEIFCFDSVVNSMSDHAQAELITGNSLIRYACGNVRIQNLVDHSMICELCGNAVVHKMKDISLIRSVYGNSHIHTMQDNSCILHMAGNAQIGTMIGQTIVDRASGRSGIENVSCGCVVLGYSHDVQIKKIEAGSVVLPLHVVGYYRPTLPFPE